MKKPGPEIPNYLNDNYQTAYTSIDEEDWEDPEVKVAKIKYKAYKSIAIYFCWTAIGVALLSSNWIKFVF